MLMYDRTGVQTVEILYEQNVLKHCWEQVLNSNTTEQLTSNNINVTSTSSHNKLSVDAFTVNHTHHTYLFS